jgi:hypothetical protein
MPEDLKQRFSVAINWNKVGQRSTKIGAWPWYRFLQYTLLAIAILFNLLHWQIGLADNGDWKRTAEWFSSKPVGFSSYWPPDGTGEEDRRFFHFWLPDWELAFHMPDEIQFSSALFLWIPGVLINRYLYSAYTVSLPVLSIFPRVVCLFYLWVVFRWINFHTRWRTLFTLAMGLPLALMLSATDYVAYFNSLYHEVGTIVYLGLLIGLVLIIRERGYSLPMLLAYIVVITFFCTAKTSNFYWSALAFPFVLPLIRLWKKPLIYVPIACVLIVVPAYLSLATTRPVGAERSNTFHSLFKGALTFSDRPQEQLQALGYPPESVRCIGSNAFLPPGSDCLRGFVDRLNFIDVMRVDLREPAILVRQLVYAADNAQTLSLDNLGKLAYGDRTVYQKVRMNLWSEVKKTVFPRGIALLITFGVLIAGFGMAMRRRGNVSHLGAVGLLMTLASFLELNVAMFGEGRADLIKHLLLANLTFDLALACALGLLAAVVENRCKISAT